MEVFLLKADKNFSISSVVYTDGTGRDIRIDGTTKDKSNSVIFSLKR
jgi:hypothetical protein